MSTAEKEQSLTQVYFGNILNIPSLFAGFVFDESKVV